MTRQLTQMVVVVAAILVGGAADLEAQSLANVAERAQEQRKTLQKESRVYTNADLPPVAAPDVASPAAVSTADTTTATAAPARAAGKHASAEAPLSDADALGAVDVPFKPRLKRDETHWRERAHLLRSTLDRLRENVTGFQGRAASLRSRMESAPPDQARSLSRELQLVTGMLARYEAELRNIDRDWTAFEQRARAANIPQDWIE